MSQIDNEIFKVIRAQIRVLTPVKTILPFQDATMGPFNTFSLSILTLEDEEGNIGEAPVFSTYINILEQCLFPILFHKDNIPYKDLYQLLYWSIRNEGFRGQASALLGQLDMALHDLAARRKKLPLYKYLNGTKNRVKIYGSGGGTNYSYAELEQELTMFLNMGIDCVKIKVGRHFGQEMDADIKRVQFVRKFIGDQVRLAVDANQIWTAAQAMEFMNRVEDQNIAWMEEPVHSAAYAEIEKLCKISPIKIAYGESERTARMFPALINAGVTHLQPVPTQLGGIGEWLEVKELAQQAGIEFSSGGYSLYTASLMTTAPDNFQVEYLYPIMFALEQYFMIHPKCTNGAFIIPEIEGLPIRIDWDYWESKKKVIMNRVWNKDQINAYDPAVTM